MVGVVPNAAYRHFADRDELLAAVAPRPWRLADRMAAGVAACPAVRRATAARCRLGAIGTAYLEFARDEPGLFATAFALPQQHAYGARRRTEPDRSPLGQLRARLDELVDAGVLDPRRREGIEYPIWSAVHGLAVLTGQGPLRDVRMPRGITSTSSPWPSSTRPWPEPGPRSGAGAGVHHGAVHQGEVHLGQGDLGGGLGEQVAVEHHEVGALAGLDRARVSRSSWLT